MEKEEMISLIDTYCFESFDLLKRFQGPRNKLRAKDVFVLIYIYYNEDHKVTISDLSLALHVTPAAVSQSVNSYERLGWVKRIRSMEDRRTVYVQISDSMQKIIEEEWEKNQKKLSNYLDYLGDDAENFVRIIQKTAQYMNLTHDENVKNIFDLSKKIY